MVIVMVIIITLYHEGKTLRQTLSSYKKPEIKACSTMLSSAS